jgi:hypothetical protein
MSRVTKTFNIEGNRNISVNGVSAKVTLECDVPDEDFALDSKILKMIDGIIKDNIAENFAREGRPNAWQPLDPKYRRRRINPSGKLLQNTKNMYRNIMRGKSNFEKNKDGQYIIVYKFPMEGGKNSFKYTVPLTGAISSGKRRTYYGSSIYNMRKKKDIYHKAKKTYTVPPRPYDYIAPESLYQIYDLIARNIVFKDIKKELNKL